MLLSVSTVATVLTACGIETLTGSSTFLTSTLITLQQYLPLAVLKQYGDIRTMSQIVNVVATVLTACGIETIG